LMMTSPQHVTNVPYQSVCLSVCLCLDVSLSICARVRRLRSNTSPVRISNANRAATPRLNPCGHLAYTTTNDGRKTTAARPDEKLSLLLPLGNAKQSSRTSRDGHAPCQAPPITLVLGRSIGLLLGIVSSTRVFRTV